MGVGSFDNRVRMWGDLRDSMAGDLPMSPQVRVYDNRSLKL